ELHAGVATTPGGVGDLAQEVAGLERLRNLAGGNEAGGPRAVFHHRPHEIVRRTHRVVGILEEDRAVGRAVDRRVIPRLDQGPGFPFFLGLALDELDDIRVVDIEYDHLGRAPGLATGLNDSG